MKIGNIVWERLKIGWFFFYLIFNSLFFVILTLVHEKGHYLVGRYIGIPKENMKIEMGKFPQYVALRKDGEFISPVEYEKYIAAYFEYDPKGRYSFRFINAGFVAEFVSILTLFPIFNFLLNVPQLSISLTMTALAVYVGYLVLSIGMTIKTRTPWGDFGGMWEISKPRSACIITLFIVATLVLLLCSISLVYS